MGLAGSSIAFLIFGYADAIWLLFVSRLAQGGMGGTTGVMQAYIGDSVAPKDRAKALGWLSAATNSGVMIGPALGSLSWHFGHAAPGVIAAGLCLLNLLFAWRWLPESAGAVSRRVKGPSSTEETTQPAKTSVSQMVWDTIRHPRGATSQLIWIYAIAMMAFGSMTAVLALYMMERFQLNESNIGYIFLFFGGVSVIMRAGVLGRLVTLLGEVRLMRAGAIVVAVGLVSMPLPNRLILCLLVMGLVPIGTSLLFPSTTGLLSRRGSKQQLGQLMGVQQAFGGFSRIIGPIWAGSAFQYLGISVPFFVAGAIMGLVALLSTRVKPEP